MGFLTEEDKKYIIEAGARWDGKTVHNRCNEISKKCTEAFDEMIWFYENYDAFRTSIDREFASKYRSDKKPPKRGGIDSEKIVKVEKVEKFLEAYIKGFVDMPWQKQWYKDGKPDERESKRIQDRVAKVKGSLISTISDQDIELTS